MFRQTTTAVLVVMTMFRFPVFGKEASKAGAYPAIAGFWTLSADLSDVVTRRSVEASVEAWTERLPELAAAGPLLCELSEPPAYLTIVPGEGAITFVDGDGNPRTFGTSGRREPHHLGSGTAEASTRWKNNELRQEWSLPGGVQIIRTFAPARDADHLVVTIWIEGPRQTATTALRRVYLSDVVR